MSGVGPFECAETGFLLPVLAGAFRCVGETVNPLVAAPAVVEGPQGVGGRRNRRSKDQGKRKKILSGHGDFLVPFADATAPAKDEILAQDGKSFEFDRRRRD
jgi:hypothetical protein